MGSISFLSIKVTYNDKKKKLSESKRMLFLIILFQIKEGNNIPRQNRQMISSPSKSRTIYSKKKDITLLTQKTRMLISEQNQK